MQDSQTGPTHKHLEIEQDYICCFVHKFVFTSKSAAIVMSGRRLHFMGLLPNIWDVMTSEVCFDYNHPVKLICMDALTLNHSGQAQT